MARIITYSSNGSIVSTTDTNATSGSGGSSSPGLSILSGSGAPTSAIGVSNQPGYVDTTNGVLYGPKDPVNGWPSTGTSIVGPAGAVGPSNLGSQAAGFGPVALSTSSLATGTTTMQGQGASTNSYIPISASSFLGAFIEVYSSAVATFSATFTLYDQTTSTALYSTTVNATSNYGQVTLGLFSATQYIMTQGHTYVWQVAPSVALSTPAISVFPIYGMPSSSSAQQVALYPTLGYASATSITTSAASLPLYGSANNFYWSPPRTAGLYAVTAQMTAQGATPTSATAKVYLYSTPNAGGSTATNSYTPVTLTADGVMRTVIGPTTDTSSFAPGSRYFWQIVGNTSMSVTLTFQVYMFV